MVKSIPHNLPIDNGKFKFYDGNDRIEAGVDFVMSYFTLVREYNEGFSTLFLRNLIQSPTSLIFSAQSVFLLRLSSLLENSIPFLTVESTSFVPAVGGDRKFQELGLLYRNTEPAEVASEPSLFVRFI